ncbi:cell division protein FtsQ/DivIB [Nocardioides sp. J54]|uniref:cell division protein FtsQ/DivIB n=1 Tax=Nocardioides sp. J54 TaxID=935866 RepID=UPI0004BCC373|nr:FtsQ-type POTRA domain-containing protein [Nocardioides sp. J54]
MPSLRGGRAAATGHEKAQQRARRAFARRQRARRWLTWRYVLAASLAVLLVGLGVYALYFSSWLRTEGVELVGNDLVSDAKVLAAAEVPTGGPLVRVDLEAIEKRVKALAAVKEVDVSRQWPHDVRIEVTERTPVALLDLGDRVVALDAEGTSFPAPPRARDGLPRVRVGSGADQNALREGAAVVAALDGDVSSMVSYVEVRTVDEILLHLRDDRLVKWGSAEQSEDKAAVLLQLLERQASTYDVSVPGAPTTK